MKDKEFEKIEEKERYYEFQLLLYMEREVRDNYGFQAWLEGNIDALVEVLKEFS